MNELNCRSAGVTHRQIGTMHVETVDLDKPSEMAVSNIGEYSEAWL